MKQLASYNHIIYNFNRNTMLRIKIIGAEDTQQKMLLNNVNEAIRLSGIDARTIMVTDWEDIINHNIIQTPALVVRNQVLSQGFVPSALDIRRILKAFIPDDHPPLKTTHLQG
jgi:Thioredoxin domain